MTKEELISKIYDLKLKQPGYIIEVPKDKYIKEILKQNISIESLEASYKRLMEKTNSH